eukprot:scaffold112726_cov20-Tisochrysis_lutea.AAC.4
MHMPRHHHHHQQQQPTVVQAVRTGRAARGTMKGATLCSMPILQQDVYERAGTGLGRQGALRSASTEQDQFQ